MLGKITTLTQQFIKTSLLTPNYNYVIFISLVNLIKCHAHENAMHVCYENAILTKDMQKNVSFLFILKMLKRER